MSAQEWSPMQEEPEGECTGPFEGVGGRVGGGLRQGHTYSVRGLR